jgi:repressor LexA
MPLKPLTDKELEAFKAIRNSIVHNGRAPLVRELMTLLRYQSPRSVSYVLEKLELKGYIIRPGRGQMRLKKDLPGSDSHAQTVNVPLVGSAPCGTPVFAEENIECTYPVSTALARKPHRYFLLRAAGDSMNEKDIQDGNLVLVRQQPTADNGDTVVALIDGEATIKEFHRTRNAIVLKPRSTNKQHQPIILTDDFQVLGVVQSVIDL